MKYNLFELLNIAIMSQNPAVLVEGKDDPQIYRRIIDLANKNVDIYQVNLVEDFYSGCDNVIKAINRLQPKFDERIDNEKLILGIIDRDARMFRPLFEDEIDYRELRGLFILKYYSIESYFATRNNLKKIVEKVTYLTPELIGELLLDFIEEGSKSIHQEMYILSLEALKNACIVEYQGELGYDEDSVKNDARRLYFYDHLIPKIQDLEQFASENSLSISDLKAICKGKWYLHYYIYESYKKIKELKSLCGESPVPKCPSCIAGNNKDCLYKLKSGYKSSVLYYDMFEYVDSGECSDIIERISKLK